MSKRKFTIEDIKQKAKDRGFICLSNKYVNREEKMLWQYPKNHTWETSYQSFKCGSCPYCGGTPPQAIEDCKKFAEIKGGKCLSDEYINARTNLEWQCSCSNKWFANWDKKKLKEMGIL